MDKIRIDWKIANQILFRQIHLHLYHVYVSLYGAIEVWWDEKFASSLSLSLRVKLTKSANIAPKLTNELKTERDGVSGKDR